MCAIFGILELGQDPAQARQLALRQSRIQRHRGPDWSGIYVHEQAVLAHERLAIVDIQTGAQPICSADGRLALAVNGEIYNHQELRAPLASSYEFQTGSDCEVILPLYLEASAAQAPGEPLAGDFLDRLRGMFAFIIHDQQRGHWLVARDAIGIIPLYYGHDDQGQVLVASEMKSLTGVCNQVREFPPGHYWQKGQAEPQPWYRRDWSSADAVPLGQGDAAAATAAIRQGLEHSVVRHLMTDVPYGVLLSGGLDSSIVAALAARHAAMRVEQQETSPAWWPRLHSFAIGLKGSPDLAAAQAAARHIGTEHHGFEFTIEEGLDAIEEVIWHLETYDVTTVRAATPMFLMARKIRAMGIKMVLSGEGADEIFAGYLYFHKAPNGRALHEESVRKVERLHNYDCLRANKAMAAWGVEARVPFLDGDFLDLSMRLDPDLKLAGNGRIEKHLLREAFADLLPEEIAWRQKEQFSDGVGYGWIDALKEHAASRVSEDELARSAVRFPHNPPRTPEAYWFRSIFERLFPLPSAALTVPGGPSIACSTPEALAWDESLRQTDDPSGRSMRDVHRAQAE